MLPVTSLVYVTGSNPLLVLTLDCLELAARKGLYFLSFFAIFGDNFVEDDVFAL